jgi:hypothetical protein
MTKRCECCREKAWAANPGAGQYNVEESAGTLQMTEERAGKFGEEQQRPRPFELQQRTLVPGPGLYGSSREFWREAPAVEFSRAPMRPLAAAEQARRAVPGVGEYDVAPAQEVLALREPVTVFDKAEQRPMPHELKEAASVPGAGAYDPLLPPGQPAPETQSLKHET